MTIEEFKNISNQELYLKDNVIPADWEQHIDKGGFKFKSGKICGIWKENPYPEKPVKINGEEYVAIYYSTNEGTGSVSVHPKYLSISPWPVYRTVSQLLMEYIIKDENTIDSLYLKGKISYNESRILYTYLKNLEANKSINNNQLKTTKEDGRNNIIKVRRPTIQIKGAAAIRGSRLKGSRS